MFILYIITEFSTSFFYLVSSPCPSLLPNLTLAFVKSYSSTTLSFGTPRVPLLPMSVSLFYVFGVVSPGSFQLHFVSGSVHLRPSPSLLSWIPLIPCVIRPGASGNLRVTEQETRTELVDNETLLVVSERHRMLMVITKTNVWMSSRISVGLGPTRVDPTRYTVQSRYGRGIQTVEETCWLEWSRTRVSLSSHVFRWPLCTVQNSWFERLSYDSKACWRGVRTVIFLYCWEFLIREITLWQ